MPTMRMKALAPATVRRSLMIVTLATGAPLRKMLVRASVTYQVGTRREMYSGARAHLGISDDGKKIGVERQK